jgi:hypothetical protein
MLRAVEQSLQTFYASLESNEVLERADAIRALVAHPGWAVLIEALDRHERVLVERLVIGKVKEHHEYAKQTGEINGLKIALETPTRIVEMADKTLEALRAGGAGDEEETP